MSARSPRSRSAPPPGQAPLVAPNAAALLRRNAGAHADRPAIKFGDRVWTHGDYYAASVRFAALFADRLPEGGPRHVAVLLDNTPDYLFALGGAALIGAAVVGLNHTRREEHLLRDIAHADCGLVITEPRHIGLLTPIAERLPSVLTSTRFADGDDPETSLGESLADALAVHDDATDPGIEPDVDSIWALIFTSGTSDAPKAVICTQRRLLVTGNRMSMIMDLQPDDVGYVCMPLFHSSAVQVGWAPSIVTPCAVSLGRRFSASRWLADIRRYGATYFNYTGKPLAYLLAQPERSDDAENPLRVAFGNEGSPEVVANFARRFGLEVIDAYGATEGGVAVNREPDMPTGALGCAPAHVQIVDDDGVEKPRAILDHGRVQNAEACVGEIVNKQGVGPFEGYYNNPDATAKTTRNGWYWSGDLGYKDEDDYLYFAGRNADWIRVDGENFPAGPIEEALRGAPGVVLAAVYGVPDDQAGDQVMAGLVVSPDAAAFDAVAFTKWLDTQDAIGPKWRPRYLRLLHDPPTTGTNKIVKRMLVHQKFRLGLVGADEVFVRERGAPEYRRFTAQDERALQASFVAYGRERFWDL
jgi:fatty-acyl-CoA synthase